ncbi:uncharacterized protein LOC121390652 [Gigantopelta aegis]|uniref:uncharacterized protein LOC121390652 n=1 Tax=Gigantopelta aegis TaxID=1735272 RepID=UPI001B88E391|nr:uncharacterized protein LOC121390652 [Gigantopelta aegis]
MMDTTNSDHWQLRRIGNPATCPLVLDVFPLKEGTLTFGRNQKNDYFLDSRRLKNFISRTHAEIIGYYGDSGLEFKIREKGLNGTFINDIRIQGSCVLEEGDKVTFGHTNGYKIQPGEYSVQHNSEFEFVFERVSTTMCKQHKLPSIHDYNDRSECLQQSCDCKIKEFPHCKVKPADSPNIAKLHLTHENTLSYVGSSPGPELMTKDGPQSEFTKNSPVLNHQSENESKNSVKETFDEDASFVCDDARFIQEVCLEDGSDSSEEDPEIQILENGEREGVRHSSGDSNWCDSVDGFHSDNNLETATAELQDPTEKLVSTDYDVNENLRAKDVSLEVLQTCDETKDVMVPFQRQSPCNFVQESTPDESLLKATLQDIQNLDQVTNRSKIVPVTKHSEPQHIHKSSNIKKDNKETRELVVKKNQAIEVKSQSNNKRKKAQPKTRRKKRRNPHSDSESDELEDGVEWYDNETCASASCTRPRAKRVAWVQCDDCDQWYHTACADCSYEMVKDSKMQFHCGC